MTPIELPATDNGSVMMKVIQVKQMAMKKGATMVCLRRNFFGRHTNLGKELNRVVAELRYF
jgi:hypothetical protein